VAAAMLKADPSKSNRAVAKTVKLSDKTVADVRGELERRSEIPHVESRTDTKGREQPTRKRKPADAPEQPAETPRVVRSGCRHGIEAS
jgi:hypothetical protein